jgi:peptide/nickel transport system permease protein
MGAYIIRRLLWLVLILFWVSILTFVLVLAAPGDPAQMLAGNRAMGDSVDLLRKQYGLDQPIHVQYLKYMRNVAQGDFGYSFYFKRPVRDAIFERLPATAMLAVSIIVVSIALGVPMGIVGAMRHNSIVDRALMFFGLLSISLPTFFLGLLLIYVFAFRLGLFPIGGYGTLRHLVLPTLSVALPWSAWYATILRSNMLDAKTSDYVRTGYAKGLGDRQVTLRHMLPNAVLPVVAMVSMDLAGLLTGIALVEAVFSWPGLGWQALQAAQRKDLPLIMGSVFFGAVMIGLGNLIADVLNGRLDPRAQLD